MSREETLADAIRDTLNAKRLTLTADDEGRMRVRRAVEVEAEEPEPGPLVRDPRTGKFTTRERLAEREGQ